MCAFVRLFVCLLVCWFVSLFVSLVGCLFVCMCACLFLVTLRHIFVVSGTLGDTFNEHFACFEYTPDGI